jgi:hypothetical protein
MAAEPVISKKTSSNAFNFEQAVKQMLDKDSLIADGSEIVIWGGSFSTDRLPDFLKVWDFAAMPYVLKESAHDIDFRQEEASAIASQIATHHGLLERARIFGANKDMTSGGDLNLRRDEDAFLWHFIGANDTARQVSLAKLQNAGFESKDFWKENPGCQLRLCDESALLWGDYKEDQNKWRDDRVGWAELFYPIADMMAKKNGQRMQIDYTVFTDSGQVAFVWWKEIKKHG